MGPGNQESAEFLKKCHFLDDRVTGTSPPTDAAPEPVKIDVREDMFSLSLLGLFFSFLPSLPGSGSCSGIIPVMCKRGVSACGVLVSLSIRYLLSPSL